MVAWSRKIIIEKTKARLAAHVINFMGKWENRTKIREKLTKNGENRKNKK
jgi:hypothetical protein